MTLVQMSCVIGVPDQPEDAEGKGLRNAEAGPEALRRVPRDILDGLLP